MDKDLYLHKLLVGQEPFSSLITENAEAEHCVGQPRVCGDTIFPNYLKKSAHVIEHLIKFYIYFVELNLFLIKSEGNIARMHILFFYFPPYTGYGYLQLLAPEFD
ncbi:hypothetical protein BpHYR1_046410 [Brachionus plicatilis]|uniref:Uncharacterized protein n=1 Tax=Brachionus plicatilis TaxID=10195 RepID=A0A3M7RI60_BRAPC|nr:hypothetical protein BpHYR1_046410 [Brachionus plicatilis]